MSSIDGLMLGCQNPSTVHSPNRWPVRSKLIVSGVGRGFELRRSFISYSYHLFNTWNAATSVAVTTTKISAPITVALSMSVSKLGPPVAAASGSSDSG
jgi:hypothetical protein